VSVAIIKMIRRNVAVSMASLALAFATACTEAAGPGTPFPVAANDNARSAGPLQTAVLAGGCFDVVSGYAGGDKGAALYEVVSSGRTGHAESVRITFDPQQVSYGELLRIFFAVAHDPTQLNRQGPDSGTQYRSSIFYADETQKQIAQAYRATEPGTCFSARDRDPCRSAE
jgi:peptide-methionine (S)-S-oxide reductase